MVELSHILKYLFHNNAKFDSIPLTRFRDVSERFYTILLFNFIRKNKFIQPVSLWIKAKKVKDGKKYTKAFLTSETLHSKTNELYSLLSKHDILHEDEEYLNDDYMDLSMEYDDVRGKFLDCHKDISYNAVPREIEFYFWIDAFTKYDYNVLEYLFLTLSYTNLWFEKGDVAKALKMLDFDRLLAEWEYLCTIMDTKYLVFREYYSYFPFDEFL